MGLGKWVGSAMGFMTLGPLGALAGDFIGSCVAKQAVGMQEDLQADEAGRARYEQGQRNSFLFSMLVMASYVIRADRKSCTAKWNSSVVSFVRISGRAR